MKILDKWVKLKYELERENHKLKLLPTQSRKKNSYLHQYY